MEECPPLGVIVFAGDLAVDVGVFQELNCFNNRVQCLLFLHLCLLHGTESN
jgi:hypothetical protein